MFAILVFCGVPLIGANSTCVCASLFVVVLDDCWCLLVDFWCLLVDFWRFLMISRCLLMICGGCLIICGELLMTLAAS